MKTFKEYEIILNANIYIWRTLNSPYPSIEIICRSPPKYRAYKRLIGRPYPYPAIVTASAVPRSTSSGSLAVL
jgi:hypothetical protein